MFVRDAGSVAGILVAIVVSLSAQAPTGDLARYRDTLAHLDTTSPACLESARAALTARFPHAHPDREAALRAFREFYTARYNEWQRVLIEDEGPRMAFLTWREPAASRLPAPVPIATIRDWTSAEAAAARRANPAVTARLDALRRWPFAVVLGEGDWYLEPDTEWLAEVAKALPSPLADLMQFLAREDRQPLAGDSALAMSWDELRQRIVRWDAFARSHAGLPETASEVRPRLRGLLRLYLCPTLDNTPEYDRATRRLAPELRASYTRFVAENHDVQGYPFVVGLLDVLKGAGFTLTPAVASYLARTDSPVPCEDIR